MTTTTTTTLLPAALPILATRPWAADALASAAAAATASASDDSPSSRSLLPLLQHRLTTLGTLLYDRNYDALEAAVAERKGREAAQAKLRGDRVIIAEHYKGVMEKGVEAASEKKEKEVGEAKANMLRELQALKPLALKKLVQDYQAALAKAGGGGARLFFDGGAGSDDEEDEDEDGGNAAAMEEGEGEEGFHAKDPYRLTPAGSGFGTKRSSSMALVTPGSAAAAAAGAKRIKKAARAEKEKLRERLTNALVGEEGAAGGHSAGAEDVAALLGMGEGGPDEAALVSEALAALNTDLLAAKMAQAQRVAQREVEREHTDRFNKAVEKGVTAALASLRQELQYEMEARVEEEVERQRVLLETDYDLQKKNFEAQLRAELGAAAAAAAGRGGAEVEAAGRGKKGKK